MYKAKLSVLGVEIEFDTQDEQTLWRKLALFHGVPAICPIDDTPARFFHKAPEGNDYFEVRNSGAYLFECAFGQYKDKSGLFPKGAWTWWDWERKQDIVLFENGKLTEAGQAMRRRCLGSASSPTGAPPDTSGIHADDNPDRYPESLDDVPEIAPAPVPVEKPTHRKIGTVDEKQLNTLHALGMALYGAKAEWDTKRAGLVQWVSNGRVTSSAELYVAECVRLLEALDTKIRISYEKIAEGWPSPFDLANIDELHGVELADAYKRLKALVAAPKAAQEKRNAIAAIRG